MRHRNISDKNSYILLCADVAFTGYIPIFAQPYWLDVVAEKWDVVLHKKEGKIIAALPYCIKGHLLTKRIYLPDLSFYQSVLFFDDKLTIETQQKTGLELFRHLPKTVKSFYKFLPKYHALDLSPLHYTKEDYASYFIAKNDPVILSEQHKRNFQKGLKKGYTLRESEDIEASFALLTSTFTRQNISSKINLKTFKQIREIGLKNQCAKTVDCTDETGNLLASVFVAYDKNTMYYLMGGYNTTYKNSGAMTFLLQQIIIDSQLKKLDFNFCGSSKKSIAHFFEGFGAQKKDIAIWKKNMLQSLS